MKHNSPMEQGKNAKGAANLGSVRPSCGAPMGSSAYAMLRAADRFAYVSWKHCLLESTYLRERTSIYYLAA